MVFLLVNDGDMLWRVFVTRASQPSASTQLMSSKHNYS